MRKHTPNGGPTKRRVSRALAPLGAAAALTLGGAAPALAQPASGFHRSHHYRHPVTLVAVTPSPGDTAGAGGVFNIDLALLARNAHGNGLLSAANGYKPGLNLPPASTSGPGKSDPDVPGLVVTLSTTPAAAGGPKANLAGLFQENDVARSSFGQQQVFSDWGVAKPGLFGKNAKTTLTAYVVQGTAPGTVTGKERRISNTVHETFTIRG